MVTFIIGNGFDLQMGLKTRYTDFYKIYTKIKQTDSPNIKRFKEKILEAGWETWADFELQMGKHTSDFKGHTAADDFLECFDDFVVSFNHYLFYECRKIDWDSGSAATRLKYFERSIRSFYNNIESIPRKLVEELGNFVKKLAIINLNINFLQFNYTPVFDVLLNRADIPYLENIHVHGEMSGGYPTMGVNDVYQILNEKIKSDERVQTVFVKPNFSNAWQTQDVNQESAKKRALGAIKNSKIICVFGSSIGETDRYWWEQIGEWLKGRDGILVIFDKYGVKDDGISPLGFLNAKNISERRNWFLRQFARLSGLDEWVNDNPSRIIIEFNTDMFNFGLPMKS